MDNFKRMSAADQMQFVLVYSDTLYPHFLVEPHLSIWWAFILASRLCCQTSYTPTEIDLAEQAMYAFNRLLSETYHGRAFVPKVHGLTHKAH